MHRDDLLVPLLCTQLVGTSEVSAQICRRLEARQAEIAELQTLLILHEQNIGRHLALGLEASRLHAETQWCLSALAFLANDLTDRSAEPKS